MYFAASLITYHLGLTLNHTYRTADFFAEISNSGRGTGFRVFIFVAVEFEGVLDDFGPGVRAYARSFFFSR